MIDGSTVPKKIKSLVDGGGKPKRKIQEGLGLEESSLASESTKESDQPSSRNGNADRTERSRGRAKDTEERDRSVSPRSRSISRSRSSSPESMPGDKTSATAAKRIGNKRKKMAQRNMLLSSLTSQEREKTERAVFCLENEFSRIWRQKRHNKRMRAILDYESIYRARLVNVHGLALLAVFEKDLVAKVPSIFWRGASVSDFLKTASSRNSSTFAENSFIPSTVPLNSFENIDNCLSNIDTKAVPDILQFFVQSIVLASRAGHWSEMFRFSQTLWSTTQFLIRNGIMAIDSDWKKELWRAYSIVGDCLLDLVDNVNAIKEEFNMAERLQSSPPLTEVYGHQKIRIKDDNLDSFSRSNYACKWYDIDKGDQIECKRLENSSKLINNSKQYRFRSLLDRTSSDVHCQYSQFREQALPTSEIRGKI